MVNKPRCLNNMDVTLFEQWCHNYRVEMVIIFGSQAKGTARPDSDIDLGILLVKHPIPVEEELQLCLDLVGAVRTGKVDMVLLNHADPSLCYDAACHGIVIYEKKAGTFNRFKVRAFKRFADTEPLRKLWRLYDELWLRGEITRAKQNRYFAKVASN